MRIRLSNEIIFSKIILIVIEVSLIFALLNAVSDVVIDKDKIMLIAFFFNGIRSINILRIQIESY